MRVLNTIIDNDRSTNSHGVKSLSEAIENRSFSSNCDKQLIAVHKWTSMSNRVRYYNN